MTAQEQVLACDLTALPPGGEGRLRGLCEELFGHVDEVESRPDGFEFGFHEASADTTAKLAEFIYLDRLCCGFVRHGLFQEPHETGIWLHLSGADGVKEMIAGDVVGLLRPEVAKAAGLDG